MEEFEFNAHNKVEYPPMHTAEHILNGVMDRKFGCGRAFSMHLEKKKSKCDYHFNRDITEEERLYISKEVNDIISKNIEITYDVVDIETAKRLVPTEKLPDDASKMIRLVKIGEYDICACIGLHVKNTSEIGIFAITTSSFENGVLRLRFKLG